MRCCASGPRLLPGDGQQMRAQAEQAGFALGEPRDPQEMRLPLWVTCAIAHKPASVPAPRVNRSRSLPWL